ncbi:hypothetical protein CLV59_106222 [Chitinophaga dinghuensis]|uniref:Uncharacterized protein n=1 Tax=Chitinophaga dinghuensis TaxID=1539050 RepID=A0A327VSX6_9BACT|nr:hypothetical protein [Chitinophaga dinghuensis]RAJ79161.1 hypothetical protein CLV59_106222 [Chitinophaga dinghuensis]
MNKRYFVFALLCIMAACKDQPKKQVSQVDPAAFKAFVQALPYVQTPLAHPEYMSLIKELHTVEDTATNYEDLRAGRIRTADDVIVIFYYGEKKHKGRFWVTSYNAEGTILEQTEIGEKIDEDGTSKYVNRIVMENDSIIECRKYYSVMDGSFNAFDPDKPSEVRFLAIRPGGKMVWKRAEKESFQTYLANFEKLTTPLSYESTPEMSPFQQAYRGGSWLDYGGLLSTTFPNVSKMGKLELPGKPTMVLLKVNDMDTGGDLESYGPSLMLVAYNTAGRETDRLEVTGTYSTEGFESATTNFNMEQDGSFGLMKSSTMSDNSDNFGSVNAERIIKYTVSPEGRFIKNYTAVKFVVGNFEPATFEMDTSNIKPADDSEYLGILEDWNLALFIHTYVVKNDKIMRLITANKAGQIMGSAILMNTFVNEIKLPTSITVDYLKFPEKGVITGPVTVTVADNTYAIGKDGSIVKQ